MKKLFFLLLLFGVANAEHYVYGNLWFSCDGFLCPTPTPSLQGGGGGYFPFCSTQGNSCYATSDCCQGLTCSQNYCQKKNVNFLVSPSLISPSDGLLVNPPKKIMMQDIFVINRGDEITLNYKFACSGNQLCMSSWCNIENGLADPILKSQGTKTIKLSCYIPQDARKGKVYEALFQLFDEGKTLNQTVRMYLSTDGNFYVSNSIVGLGELFGDSVTFLKKPAICFEYSTNCMLNLKSDLAVSLGLKQISVGELLLLLSLIIVLYVGFRSLTTLIIFAIMFEIYYFFFK